MPELILVRHVETDMAGQFCGHSDPPINDAGRAQLISLINALRFWKIDHIYASDLQRSRQTAEAIAQEFSIPMELRPGLREIHFGEWEGLRWNEIELKDAKVAQLWISEHPYSIAPGGEKYTQFASRVDSEAKLLFQRARESRIVVVTHAGVIREILSQCCGVSSDVSWSWTKEYGAFVVVDGGRVVYRSGERAIQRGEA